MVGFLYAKVKLFGKKPHKRPPKHPKRLRTKKMNVSDENNTAEANDENSTPSAKHTDIKHLGIIYAFFTTKTELTKERNYTTFIPKRT